MMEDKIYRYKDFIVKAMLAPKTFPEQNNVYLIRIDLVRHVEVSDIMMAATKGRCDIVKSEVEDLLKDLHIL